MKSFIGCFIGLVLSVSVGAEPLLEGRVRLASGESAVGVQVRLFDLTDLRRSVGTTTDAAGHFALSLQSFSAGMALPDGFALGQNYPNPFNPSTIIPYQIPASAHVRLEVFNLLGQRLATLVDGERQAGAHTARWDATDAAGRAVGAGVYIYRLSSGGQTVSRRMVLVDGQAGISRVRAALGPVLSVVEGSVEADGLVYGLTVSGEGLVAYVDPAFPVGIDTASIVVEPYNGTPRMKLAAGGTLGDVNNDGQVDLSDLLFVMLYSTDSSIMLPNNGDISLGDVNEDGRVNSADAVLLIRYLSDPFDPALPLKIGRTEVSLGSSISGSLSAGAVDQFVIEMSSSGTLVVYTTSSIDTRGTISDSSGNSLASNDDGGEGSNFRIFTSVSAGTYYVEVRGYSSSTTGNYTLHVRTNDPDLVVASSVNDSTLAFGQPFTLQATVRNQGFGEIDPTVLFYYRSTDARITASDTQIDVDVVELNASGTSRESTSLIAPENAGTYYYGACVQSVSRESNTNNNCSDAVRVTVSRSFVYTPSTLSRMYWTDAGTEKIQRANLDGSNVEDLVTRVVAPIGIALDVGNGKMYWTDPYTEKIQRANLDGSNVEDLVTTGLSNPRDIALDVGNGKMYWTDPYTEKIQRANLNGSNVEDLVTRVVAPVGIALDVGNGKMYWTDVDTDKIQRANLDGSNVEDLVTRVVTPVGIALDVGNGKMYWTDPGTEKIQRANLDGSNVEDLVTTGLDYPRGIALDVGNGKMYWTDANTEKIQRANLNGSNVEDLVTQLGSPRDIALGP